MNPFYFDSETWFFLRLKELNLSSNMAQRIEFLFSISQRIGVFQYDSLKITQRIVFSWLKELIFFKIWVKEFNSFLKYDAKSCTLFLNTTQRIEPFFLWIRRKELNPLSLNTTQRIESFVFEHDAKNWILFDSENWFFKESKNWTFLQIWLEELNFCLVWV